MSTALKPRDPATELDDFPELADDPVWQAYMNAPVGEPETPEQRRMAAEAMRGPFTPGPVMTAEIAARCSAGE